MTMDPLSISAGIIAILQFTAQIIGYCKDTTDATREQKALLDETAAIQTLLKRLNDKLSQLKTSDESKWIDTLKSLKESLDQFDAVVRNLAANLRPPRSTFRVFRKSLTWHFEKDAIKDYLNCVERYKSLFSLALQNDQFDLSLEIGSDVQEVRAKIKDIQIAQNSQEGRLQDKQNQVIVEWLSTLNFWTRQNDCFVRREEGTGEWLLQEPTFKAWLNGSNKTLWCPGIPGAGKTILASFIIDYLEHAFDKDVSVGLAFVYCNYRDQDQSCANVCGALMQQLLLRRLELTDEILQLYGLHSFRRTRPSLPEISKLMPSVFSRFSKVFVIIDALDEYPEQDGIRTDLLFEIQKLQITHPSLRLLITSRPHIVSDIELYFKDAVRLDIQASPEDITRYLSNRVRKEVRLQRHIAADPSLEATIINTIVEKANGIFLLARLHIDSLAWKYTLKEVREALKSLHKELDETYQSTIDRIWSQRDEALALAKQVLSWLTYAKRSLTVVELQLALSITPADTHGLDKEALPDQDFLISVCAGLITVDRESNIIRFVHYTTQEYFERIRDTRLPDAEIDIASTCLKYISLVEATSYGYHEVINCLSRDSMLAYAGRYWGFHARSQEDKMQDAILRFLECERERDLSFCCLVSLEKGFVFYLAKKGIPPLHFASAFGLERTVGVLMNMGVDVMETHVGGYTALHWAASFGRKGVVELLLKSTSPGLVEARDEIYSETALHYAAQYGHEKVIQLLVENGVDIEARNILGETALDLAIKFGHREAAEMLKTLKERTRVLQVNEN